MLNTVTQLGETEWAILRICLKKGKTRTRIIHEEFLKSSRLPYSKVKITLDKLVNKKYLKSEKYGPIWLYSPVMNEKTIIEKAIDEFIGTFLDDSIIPFFKHVLKNNKHLAELREVKIMLDSFFEKENQPPAESAEQQ